jgi:hypothetical protein
VQEELVDMVKIYNPIPQEAHQVYTETILREYSLFCQKKEERA